MHPSISNPISPQIHKSQFRQFHVISDVWIDKVIVKDVTTGSVTASSLTVTPSRISLSTGQASQLTRTLSPATSTDPNVTWTSDNTDVATVNTNGLVTAMSTGTAMITATSIRI